MYLCSLSHELAKYHIWPYLSGGAKKMAQILVGRNFKTTQQNYTKLRTTISQHALNHIVNFQCKWTTNVEMRVT